MMHSLPKSSQAHNIPLRPRVTIIVEEEINIAIIFVQLHEKVNFIPIEFVLHLICYNNLSGLHVHFPSFFIIHPFVCCVAPVGKLTFFYVLEKIILCSLFIQM